MALPLQDVIAAGIGGLVSLFGGISAANRRRKQQNYLTQQERANQTWYDANALSDYTQRADAQNLMKQLREGLRKENRRAAGSAVVTGATPEVQALQKEASGKVVSDTMANIGAMGQRWKDGITNQYLARKDNLAAQRMQLMGGQAQAAEGLASTGLNFMSGLAGSQLGTQTNATIGWPMKLSKQPQVQWTPLG